MERMRLMTQNLNNLNSNIDYEPESYQEFGLLGQTNRYLYRFRIHVQVQLPPSKGHANDRRSGSRAGSFCECLDSVTHGHR